jgi:hypothetical protein
MIVDALDILCAMKWVGRIYVGGFGAIDIVIKIIILLFILLNIEF